MFPLQKNGKNLSRSPGCALHSYCQPFSIAMRECLFSAERQSCSLGQHSLNHHKKKPHLYPIPCTCSLLAVMHLVHYPFKYWHLAPMQCPNHYPNVQHLANWLVIRSPTTTQTHAVRTRQSGLPTHCTALYSPMHRSPPLPTYLCISSSSLMRLLLTTEHPCLAQCPLFL